jgi:hypothetical protein
MGADMRSYWTDRYQQHFQQFFNKPFDIQVYHDAEGGGLKLAIHDWARQGFRVYASMGLAARLERDGVEDFGEAILFSDVPDPEVPQLFVNALFFILQHNIPLGSRFAIGFGDMDRDFARRYGKSALYFTRPLEDNETFTNVLGPDSIGHVYEAFFITPEEDAFLERRGPDVFEEKFWSAYRADLTPDERIELSVDKEKAQEFQAKQQEIWQQSIKVLSVRRTSCV